MGLFIFLAVGVAIFVSFAVFLIRLRSAFPRDGSKVKFAFTFGDVAPGTAPPPGSGTGATGTAHTYKLDPQTFTTAKEMKARGMSMDDICRAVDQNYDSRDKAEQEAFRLMMEAATAGKGSLSVMTMLEAAAKAEKS